ncbi:Alpha/Beta hydrolase protein [Aspergillus heterothallicus]
MPFVNRDDGQEIYYNVHGTSGPVLILVPGYFGISDLWHPLISKRGPNYRCLTFDALGYGRSLKPEDPESYSVLRSSRDLDTVIEAAGLHDESRALVTHSIGRQYRECPLSLLSGEYFRNHLHGHILRRPQHIEIPLARSTLRRCRDVLSSTRAWALPRNLHKKPRTGPHTHGRITRTLYTISRCRDGYAEITVPTMLIQGGEDFEGPVEIAVEQMLAELPELYLEDAADGVSVSASGGS